MRTIASQESSAPVPVRCPQCWQDAGLAAMSHRTWFTLFFIPIFPVSGKTRFSQCVRCGAQFNATPEELRAALGAADRRQNQQAIALYNSLRSSPANSVTLHQLLEMYLSMAEPAEAVSAAQQFPEALNRSEQCMVALARALLALNRHGEALHWLDAATARNPGLAEAHYFKGVANLLKTPPDPAQAVAAARAARGAGHPGAEDLLREAEGRARGA